MLRRAFFAVAIALCCCIASDAQASILTLNLGGTTFSTSGGTINPNAIVMTFDDDDVVTGAADRVMLTIFFQGGVGVGTTAFIDDLVFNVDRAVSILFLSGALVNRASYSSNSKSVNPSTGYDVELDYPPPPGKFIAKFTVGESSVFRFSAAGLTSASFDLLNTDTDPGQQFRAATHIQSLPGGVSGKFGGVKGSGNINVIPAPGAFVIWSVGLAVAGIFGRFRNRRR